MSGFASWPVSLNYRPFRAGYSIAPHDAQLRTAMEQGPARKRRKWVESPAYIRLQWAFNLPEFEIFRAWHHLQLDDGARWLRLNVWTGNSWSLLPARFKGVYEPALHGLEYIVGAEIEVRQVPFLSVDDEPELLVRAWPGNLNPLPLRESYQLTPHRPVIRSDIDGPQDTKLWYQDGATSADYQWAMSGDEFEYFRSWYHHGLKDGVTWFTVPALFGGLFGTRRCRIEGAYEAELQLDYSWHVKVTLEMRDLPYLDDGALYVLGVMGGEAYQALATGIHHFVHVTYPEAST